MRIASTLRDLTPEQAEGFRIACACFALLGQRMQAAQVSLPPAPWETVSPRDQVIEAQGALIEAVARTMQRAFCG